MLAPTVERPATLTPLDDPPIGINDAAGIVADPTHPAAVLDAAASDTRQKG